MSMTSANATLAAGDATPLADCYEWVRQARDALRELSRRPEVRADQETRSLVGEARAAVSDVHERLLDRRLGELEQVGG